MLERYSHPRGSGPPTLPNTRALEPCKRLDGLAHLAVCLLIYGWETHLGTHTRCVAHRGVGRVYRETLASTVFATLRRFCLQWRVHKAGRKEKLAHIPAFAHSHPL